MNNGRPEPMPVNIYKNGRLATRKEMYEELKAKAIKASWKMPPLDPEENTGRQIWINHWVAMFEHDLKVASGDKDPGRPVIPH